MATEYLSRVHVLQPYGTALFDASARSTALLTPIRLSQKSGAPPSVRYQTENHSIIYILLKVWPTETHPGQAQNNAMEASISISVLGVEDHGS